MDPISRVQNGRAVCNLCCVSGLDSSVKDEPVAGIQESRATADQGATFRAESSLTVFGGDAVGDHTSTRGSDPDSGVRREGAANNGAIVNDHTAAVLRRGATRDRASRVQPQARNRIVGKPEAFEPTVARAEGLNTDPVPSANQAVLDHDVVAGPIYHNPVNRSLTTADQSEPVQVERDVAGVDEDAVAVVAAGGYDVTGEDVRAGRRDGVRQTIVDVCPVDGDGPCGLDRPTRRVELPRADPQDGTHRGRHEYGARELDHPRFCGFDFIHFDLLFCSNGRVG